MKDEALLHQQLHDLITVQKAQVVMLQGIFNSLNAICIGNAWKVGMYNFNDVQKLLSSTDKLTNG